MGTKEGALKTKRIVVEKYKNNFFKKIKLNNHNLLENYVDSNTSINFICNKHSLIFKVKPSKYLNRNQGCPLCSNTFSKNKETILQKIKIHCLKNELSLISSNYKNSKSNLDIKCNKCNFVFQKTSSNLYKQGCPKCSNKIQDKNVLYKNLKSLMKKESYALLEDEYKTAHSKINVCCNNNHKYIATSTGFKSGKRCPICANERHPGVINFGTLKKNNSYLTKKSYLYFLKVVFDNKVFYKVGISSNINQRVKTLNNELKQSRIQVLFSFETNYYKAFLIEQYFMSYFKYFKYVNPEKFQGYTECFNIGIDLFLVSLFFKNADALLINSEKESELLGYLEAKQTTK